MKIWNYKRKLVKWNKPNIVHRFQALDLKENTIFAGAFPISSSNTLYRVTGFIVYIKNQPNTRKDLRGISKLLLWNIEIYVFIQVSEKGWLRDVLLIECWKLQNCPSLLTIPHIRVFIMRRFSVPK